MNQINVVISGFGPYADLEVNPSYEVPSALESAENLAKMQPSEDICVKVTSVMLPISFANAWPKLLETIEREQANIVIATGTKHTARGVQLERCATNVIDAKKPDVDNSRPQKMPIVEDGPAAYWTRLPLRMILQRFAHDSIASNLSSDAGTYVCNSLFYQLLHWAAKDNKRVLAGFVSFPPVVSLHDARNGLPLKQQIEAGQDIVREAVRYYMQPFAEGMLLKQLLLNYLLLNR